MFSFIRVKNVDAFYNAIIQQNKKLTGNFSEENETFYDLRKLMEKFSEIFS